MKLVFPGPHLHPEDLLDLMQLEPPTLSLGVPTIWMSLIQTYDAAQDPAVAAPRPLEAAARHALAGGRRGGAGGADPRFDRHGIWIMQGWGMTETSPVCTISYPRAELQDASGDEKYRRAAMAGRRCRWWTCAWGDEGEQPWDGKSVGEIQVRGPFITGSYHEVPVSEKFTADGWLRTGDVASVDELGFVRITDRTKDLIKSGGEWISSVDLENALMAHPSVAEAAVIAIPDEKWSERPLACVVLKKGATHRRAQRAPAEAQFREMAAAGALRVHRGGPPDVHRKVLEDEAAREVSEVRVTVAACPARG